MSILGGGKARVGGGSGIVSVVLTVSSLFEEAFQALMSTACQSVCQGLSTMCRENDPVHQTVSAAEHVSRGSGTGLDETAISSAPWGAIVFTVGGWMDLLQSERFKL